MGIFNKLFRKKKEASEEVKETTPEEATFTELEEICKNDPEVYEALKDTMFLDPTKIEITLKEAVSKAEEFEKANDLVRAAFYYEIAGGLALYEGDASKVKKYFSKYAKLTKKELKILNVLERAVEKAQEYYAKVSGKEKGV